MSFLEHQLFFGVQIRIYGFNNDIIGQRFEQTIYHVTKHFLISHL